MAEDKSGTPLKRRKNGRGKPFPKGKSGNPAGRPAGIPNKVTQEVREAARALVEDPEYRDALRLRLHSGELAPGVESMLWHYAYGKPKESVELTGADGAPLIPVTGVEVVLVNPGTGA